MNFSDAWRRPNRFLPLGILLLVGCPNSPSATRTSNPHQPTVTAGSSQTEAKPVAPSPTGSPTPSPTRPAEPSPTPLTISRFRFDDESHRMVEPFVYRNGEEAGVLSIVESLGGGCGMIDFDQDQRWDLVLPGGGQFQPDQTLSGLPSGLYHNAVAQFHSVTQEARLNPTNEKLFYSHGVAVGDFDADGFPDFAMTGYGGLALFHNLGDGSFECRKDWLRMVDPMWSSSAAWGDYNHDGQLDLYVSRYVNWSMSNHPVCISSANSQRDICPPKSFEPLPHLLFLNDGQGQFVESSSQSGLRTDGKGLGVVSADFDNDADLDIYVANDTTDNFLYLNDGHGIFEEVGLKHGVAVDERGLPNGSMGVSVYDIDRNGWTDIWVANYEREAFAMYQNSGAAQFLHTSRRTGITALGGSFVGFGTELVDLDSDGQPEIVVANGHVIRYPTAAPRKQLPVLMSMKGGRFERQLLAADSYFSAPREGRGLAIADLDMDGRLDIAISHLNAPVSLLYNRTDPVGRSLRIQLVGTDSNRDAIGARVVLRTDSTVDDRAQMIQVTGGSSYLSSSWRVLCFSIPQETSTIEVEIQWPSPGKSERRTLSNQANWVTTLENHSAD